MLTSYTNRLRDPIETGIWLGFGSALRTSIGAASAAILKPSIGAGGGALFGLFGAISQIGINAVFEKYGFFKKEGPSYVADVAETAIEFFVEATFAWSVATASLNPKHHFSYLDAMALQAVTFAALIPFKVCLIRFMGYAPPKLPSKAEADAQIAFDEMKRKLEIERGIVADLHAEIKTLENQLKAGSSATV